MWSRFSIKSIGVYDLTHPRLPLLKERDDCLVLQKSVTPVFSSPPLLRERGQGGEFATLNHYPSRAKTQTKMKLNNRGYTLLESMVALVLFLLVVVPLMARMSIATKMNRGVDVIIASSILEQESMHLRLFPEDFYMTRSRSVNGQEWKIKGTMTGNAFKTITLSASKNNRVIERCTLYLHDGEKP